MAIVKQWKYCFNLEVEPPVFDRADYESHWQEILVWIMDSRFGTDAFCWSHYFIVTDDDAAAVAFKLRWT